MFEGSSNQRSTQFIQHLYLANGKDHEKTMNMFLCGNIPEDEKTELTIVETQPKNSQQERMIDTVDHERVRLDVARDYVLEEFKDVLFPKKKNKYEIAHLQAMAQQRAEEEEEDREARRRILYLANNQYDDDPEESVVR